MKVIRTPSSKIGQQAICDSCDKNWGWYKTAAVNARNHALKTGHTVSVETTTAYSYEPQR